MAVSFTFGCMKSGKTEALIKELLSETMNGHDQSNVLVMKPSTDTRSQRLKSRTGNSFSCMTLRPEHSMAQLLETVRPSVVYVDEAQFMSPMHLHILCYYSELGKHDVNFYGLDKNFKGNLFRNTIDLFKRADTLTQLHAICDVCGSPATQSQLLTDQQVDVSVPLIGDSEYSPRCQEHFCP